MRSNDEEYEESETEGRDKKDIDTSFLPLCIQVAKSERPFTKKEYFDGEHTINVHKFDNSETPTRVHKKSGVVELRQDFNRGFSTVLFCLVWAFVKHGFEADIEADFCAIEICRNVDGFIEDELKADISEILPDTEKNRERILFIRDEAMEDYQTFAVIKSDIYDELLVVTNDVHFVEKNTFVQQFFLSIFTLGIYKPKPNIFKRLKVAFKLLFTGRYILDEIVLSDDNARELAEFINDSITQINGNNEKEESE